MKLVINEIIPKTFNRIRDLITDNKGLYFLNQIYLNSDHQLYPNMLNTIFVASQ